MREAQTFSEDPVAYRRRWSVRSFSMLKSAFINKLIKCIYGSYATYCLPSEASRELAQHCPDKTLGKLISWGSLLIVAASGLIGKIRATNFERP